MLTSPLGNQVSILGQSIQEINNVESETYNQLGQLMVLKQRGVSDDVGTQIAECLMNAGARVGRINSRGFQQIANSNQTYQNREQTLIYWGELRGRVLKTLRGYMESYCDQRMNEFGSNIAQEIQIGSSNFRTEMEGYLMNADGRFMKLNEDLGGNVG